MIPYPLSIKILKYLCPSSGVTICEVLICSVNDQAANRALRKMGQLANQVYRNSVGKLNSIAGTLILIVHYIEMRVNNSPQPYLGLNIPCSTATIVGDVRAMGLNAEAKSQFKGSVYCNLSSTVPFSRLLCNLCSLVKSHKRPVIDERGIGRQRSRKGRI